MKKMKIASTFWAVLITAFQLSAQCRLVRVESSDTSTTYRYYYDKLGRLSSSINEGIYQKETYKMQHHFAYNDKGKVVSVQAFYKDTLSNVKNYIYEGDKIKQVFFIDPKDTILERGQLFYNQQGQLSHYFCKKTNGDTISTQYEYAPKGWLKKVSQQSSKRENSFIWELNWDPNQDIIDEPSRIFFAGYPINPMAYMVYPIESLSIKGAWKSSVFYTINKEGKPLKDYDDEESDVKSNAEGLWIENKYRNSSDNKIITLRAFYEGCKN
jgi:YD repeat-containing protein